MKNILKKELLGKSSWYKLWYKWYILWLDLYANKKNIYIKLSRRNSCFFLPWQKFTPLPLPKFLGSVWKSSVAVASRDCALSVHEQLTPSHIHTWAPSLSQRERLAVHDTCRRIWVTRPRTCSSARQGGQLHHPGQETSVDAVGNLRKKNHTGNRLWLRDSCATSPLIRFLNFHRYHQPLRSDFDLLFCEVTYNHQPWASSWLEQLHSWFTARRH